MDLKDVIASDRKEGAIEFLHWYLDNKFEYIDYFFESPTYKGASSDVEELYNIYMNEQSI